MEDSIDIGAVEIVIFDGLEKIILVLVVDELQATQVLVIIAVLQVIYNQDVGTAPAVQFLHDIAADKAGTAGYDNHWYSSS